MANYIPTSQTRYFREKLFSAPKFAQLMAAGVMGPDPMDAEVLSKGDVINLPKTVQAAAFGRVDLTSTTAASGTRVATNDGKAPVLRDYSLNYFLSHDQIRANENWRQHLDESAGNQASKNVISNLDNALKGALAAMTTSHTSNQTGSALTVQFIRGAKALLGDQYDTLDTMLVHSAAWADLIYDLTVNYKYSGNMSSEWLADGYISNVMGISKIIVSDDLTADAGATSSAGDDVYHTYIFNSSDSVPGFQPIYFGYQSEARIEEFVDARVPSTQVHRKYSMDYVVGIRGVAYSAAITTNPPAKTDLATSGNWTPATEDHRNVGVVQVLSAGNVN